MIFHISHYISYQKYENKLVELEDVINKKTRETKRLRDSFDTIKTANDSLKKQVTFLASINSFFGN